jgi:F-type H+-transporting ATPase subunit epsilon
MRLRVLLPERVLVERPVRKVVAEAENGCFGMLPRHVDFVAPLAPGILSYVDDEDGEERFLATAEGMLVKLGDEVLVSVRGATAGGDLGELERAVRREISSRGHRELQARRAVSRLEADIVRRFVDLREEAP